jgi:hypothetical protein
MLFATEWTTQQTQPHQPQRPQLFILRFYASKYANQISDLHEAQKRNLFSGLIKSAVCNSPNKINNLNKAQKRKISSLKGRCHPQKRGVAPSREPIWWDDG